MTIPRNITEAQGRYILVAHRLMRSREPGRFGREIAGLRRLIAWLRAQEASEERAA